MKGSFLDDSIIFVKNVNKDIMDNIPESTKEEPLKFYQWMFLENGINLYRNSFFAQYQEFSDVIIDKDKISYPDIVGDNYDNPVEITRSFDFRRELEVRLSKEYNKSLKLIKSAIADITFRGSNLSPYLDLLHTHIQELLTQTKTISEKYLFVRDLLQHLLTYIKEGQKVIGQVSNGFNIEEKPLIQNIGIDSKDKLIHELFGFLQGRYIPDTDWEYLITYLKAFIIEYKIPNIEDLISLPRTNRAMVKWMFYAFYNKLPDNRGIQDKVSELYLRLFETLTPTEKEIKNISKKSSAKPKKLPDDFPSIKGLK